MCGGLCGVCVAPERSVPRSARKGRENARGAPQGLHAEDVRARPAAATGTRPEIGAGRCYVPFSCLIG